MAKGARFEAKQAGLKRYFTGKICKNGHIAPRRTHDGRCTECRFPCEAPAKIAEYSARWRAKHPGREKEVKYRHLYGVELSQIRLKPTTCEICLKQHKKIVLDHCHTSGQFRGWICDPCNIALGNVQDDVGTLYRMISYLRGELVQGHVTASNDLEKGTIRQS